MTEETTRELSDSKDEPFRYDAFISYRHVEPDRQWAKWLHKALETYRVPPKLVAKKGVARRLKRIFRDEEELSASADLSYEIDNALEQSRFLILVCSSRTPESKWVNAEVLRFREMGRHDRILALLIEGEPGEAFPSALCEIRRAATDIRGGKVDRLEEIEPLAADVRSTRIDSPRYVKRMAKLRLLATLLGCRFDDLRQREHQRQLHRYGLAATLLVALLITVSVLAATALIARNRTEKELYYSSIVSAHLLMGQKRYREAREALWNAPQQHRRWEWGHLLYRTHQWRVSLENHKGSVRSGQFTPDGKMVVTGSDDGRVRLWDSMSGDIIRELSAHAAKINDVCIDLTGKLVASASDDGSVIVADVATGAQRHFFEHTDEVYRARFSPDGMRLVTACADGKSLVWDTQTGEKLATFGNEDVFLEAVHFTPEGHQKT